MTINRLAAPADALKSGDDAPPLEPDGGGESANPMGVGSRGLDTLRHSVSGMNIPSVITQRTKDAIDSDAHRARGMAKHPPAASRRHASVRETEGGATLVVDGFVGKRRTSPIDGSTYQMLAVDEATSTGFAKNTKSHTTDDWFIFIKDLILKPFTPPDPLETECVAPRLNPRRKR